MLMTDLLNRLDAMAKGHAAIHGTDSPNIFADTATELRRLYDIESNIKLLMAGMPTEGGRYYPEASLEEKVERRMELTKRLAAAVNANLPEVKGR